MSDNKKYYYLKLKDNFFDSESMIVLESMPDGYLYSNILTKLYLRSLKNEGKLMFNDRIPYNPTILAQIVRHNVGVVEKALNIFSNLGLIEILDNGAIYMMDIQNYIGHSSTEADRKRVYRERITSQNGQMSLKCPDKSPPEIEIEKELDIELKKDINKNKQKVPAADASGSVGEIYDYWNLKAKQKLSGDKSIINNLKTILRTYTIDDVKMVIDYIVNSKWHIEKGQVLLSVVSKPTLFAEKLDRALNSKPLQSTKDALWNCNDNDYSGGF
jgi:predicted phage replisome organizer